MMNKHNIIAEMKDLGIAVPSEKVYTNIENPLGWFNYTLGSLLKQRGKTMVYNDGYDQIINWLANNKGKGLVLMGGVGLGKTIIARFVIPYIFKKTINRGAYFHSAIKINSMMDVDKILSHKIIIIDDVGVEEIINEYGNKIDPLPLILDEVEKENKLIIITTNLNRKMLLEKYKDRAYDRLMSVCDTAVLKGDSLRL